MACFLRQRNLEGCNGNNIRQLGPFGKSAWDFISAIFEAGWNQLITSDNTSIRDNVVVIGDFQGCCRVGNQRQVNGGQQKSSIG